MKNQNPAWEKDGRLLKQIRGKRNKMKKKIGIKKTKMNIFWLFLIGLIIGVVIGLRQSVSEPVVSDVNPAQISQGKGNQS